MAVRKTSRNWSENRILSRLPNPRDAAIARIAVVGVGQVLQGDDGAGPAVISRLKRLFPRDKGILLLDAGHAPENQLGPVIRFRPDLILLIDAIRLGEPAGSIHCYEAAEIESYSGGSTHTLPLSLLSAFLSAESGARVYILGIQPAAIDFGEGLDPAVVGAASRLAEAIAVYWRKAAAACSAISEGEVSVVNT